MGLLIFILFLALAAGILALALYHEKKRREALERVAAQLGMRFSAQLPEEIRDLACCKQALDCLNEAMGGVSIIRCPSG
jgi:CHASE1-domain containing sensor protein